ncbi:MAG: glycosyltransferase family 39 protein [Candidatus Eremiobacteraeota bacterium]|nr:glycosyltransferase family 39 protein [Candidatus Eremiobacteraeota bacterium]
MNTQNTGTASRREGLFLAVIVIAAAALRLYDLGTKDFWFDEALSLLKGLLSIPNILNDSLSQIAPDPHPLLYPLFMKAWLRLGRDEAMVRLPSVVAGAASVYVLFLLARSLFGSRAGLYASALAAISPFLVAYSQEARNYSFHLLFSLLSLYCFWRFCEAEEKREERVWSVLYGFSTLLNMNSHYYSFFLILFENLFFFLYYRQNTEKVKRWLTIQALLLLWAFAMLPLLLHQRALVVSGGIADWMPALTLPHLATLFVNWNFTVLQLHNNLLYPWINREWCAPFILLIIIVGVIQALRRGKKGAFVIAWFAIPFSIAIVMSLSRSMLVDRYFISIIPALILLASLALSSLKPSSLQASVFGLILLVYGLSLAQYYGKYTEPGYKNYFLQSMKGIKDFRGIRGYLDSRLEAQDTVLIDDNFVFMPLLYYCTPARAQLHMLSFPEEIPRYCSSPRIFLVHSVPMKTQIPSKEAGEAAPEVLERLSEYGRLEEKAEFKGLDIFIYRKKPIPSQR